MAAPALAKDIAYVAGSRDDEQTLDIYYPEPGTQEGARRSVLVYVHGGGWGRGDKWLGKWLAPYYVERDVVFVSVNYRLAPQNRFPLFMHDLAAAMRWVKDNISRFGGDADRLVLTGHSAGAHIVALLATDPQYLKAQGLPVDMFRLVAPNDTASFNLLVDPYGLFVRRQIKIREDAFGTDRKVYAQASPTLHAAKASPASLSPFLIFVSSKRPDAVEQSHALARALKDSGNTGDVVIVPGVGHAMMNQDIADSDSPIAQGLLDRLRRK